MPTENCRITLAELSRACVETAYDKANVVVAGAMLGLPVFHSTLKGLSVLASELAPIAGVAWIGLQSYAKILEIRRRRRDEDHI